MDDIYRRFAVLITLGIFAAFAVRSAPAQGFRWPENPENLKVLSEEITPEELGATMRGFAMSLGVRCEHCHVGEPGQPLSEFDFVSDEKETKETARAMLKMVQAINGQHLADLGPDRIQVACVTCHRGVSKPLMLADELSKALDAAGVDSAVARYDELRARYYGGFAYDFSERVLTRFAETLTEQGNHEAGIAFLSLNLTHYPKSATTYWLLGSAYAEIGEAEAARKALEETRALVSDPRSLRMIDGMLEKLDADN